MSFGYNLGFDEQMPEHLLSPLQHELLLFPGAISLAFTSHSIRASDKKLQFNPIEPQFGRKDMRLASGVLGLFRAEEVRGKGNPEYFPQTRLNRSQLQEFLDFPKVDERHFVNQIRSHGVFSASSFLSGSFRPASFLPERNASMTE
jgi:hypothetical protein